MRAHKVRVLGALLILAVTGLLLTPGPAFAAPERGAKVNLNTASVDELVTLPGIGEAYAKRIIEYREKNGAFERIEDVLNVRGIGEKTFQKIRHRLTVGEKK